MPSANRPDEMAAFWRDFSHDDLMARVADLHRQRRELLEARTPEEVRVARRTVAELFLRGSGIEVGAGDRPFPLPIGVTCRYGDIRDQAKLREHFKTNSPLAADGKIDAQTFAGIAPNSLDFIISAHVIEHLENPIGSILAGLTRLRPRGHYVIAVPDQRFTFDRQRPLTPLAHLLADAQDGGASTRIEAYRDFIRWTAMAEWGDMTAAHDIEGHAQSLAASEMDIHFHVWTGQTFRELLDYLAKMNNFSILGSAHADNENIFIISNAS